MAPYKRPSAAQRSSRPSSGHASSDVPALQQMNSEKTALDALNEYKKAKQSLTFAGKMKLGFLIVTVALLSIYGIAFLVAGDREHAQKLLNIAPVAVTPQYAMDNKSSGPSTETTVVIHDHKLSRGALAGIIIGAYIGTGLLCALRCAACLSCNLAQAGLDNSGVTCCPLFGLFACGCYPEYTINGVKTPSACVPGWAPIYWLCPVCWIFGSWGCCTYTPCYTFSSSSSSSSSSSTTTSSSSGTTTG